MSGAHERAARRLAALQGEERDWILARLSAADAQRIRELLQPRPAAAAAALPEGASAADVCGALRDEPDWFVALVLARRRWPWDREVLARMEPARLEALGALAQRAREAATARACEAAMEVLAARLRELAPAPAAPSAFDDLLDGMLARGNLQREARGDGR